ncbi:MAG: ABC transporter ATP-binding protein [Pleurocapsa minor GSE-CHR-MK-17-07R]|jgi:ABC-type polysaccharide/polyol phosphate transport system ATPase subunit|nr:ABC transporter ATP-binding protein [Pleurocapsa minor GSE-CHR-MK 17-07R]
MNAMMNNFAPLAQRKMVITADKVWKRFVQNEYRPSLRHEAVTLVSRWLHHSQRRAAVEPFWALREVSFSIYEGESVALIGHNGAGKSTLFRILCGVTEPTVGTVSITGRFAPLLALGAGFNPELSGRKNIYLNAAIQGLKEKEIDSILPDIVEFSELGAFIDIPVKRYSSGMAARLGFSVAIHTVPDIVFLDEVLAVGDAAFQEKCKTRILQLKSEQRTIMLVSHSTASVRNLCNRAIWLDQGQVMMDGPVEEVTQAYENHLGLTHQMSVSSPTPQVFG